MVKKKEKKENNDPQNITYKFKDWAMRTPLYFGVNFGAVIIKIVALIM